MTGGLDRPRILDQLSRYRSFVYLAYACVDSPEQVEADLLDAFVPPGNTRFSSNISKVINAF
jgi:hypothetical protein